MMNLAQNVKITRALNAVAAGQTAQNGAVIDMANYEGVVFIAAFGTLAAGAVTGLKAQQGNQANLSTARTTSQSASRAGRRRAILQRRAVPEADALLRPRATRFVKSTEALAARSSRRDPRPRGVKDPPALGNGSKADRLAIVANRGEVLALGRCPDPIDSARALLRDGAEQVPQSLLELLNDLRVTLQLEQPRSDEAVPEPLRVLIFVGVANFLGLAKSIAGLDVEPMRPLIRAIDPSESVAPLGERHERGLTDLVGHVGDAIDVGDELNELLLGELIDSLQESLGKLLGWRIPVEICRDRDVTLGQVATEVFGGDAANEAVEIGHGRRTFVCPQVAEQLNGSRRPLVTPD